MTFHALFTSLGLPLVGSPESRLNGVGSRLTLFQFSWEVVIFPRLLFDLCFVNLLYFGLFQLHFSPRNVCLFLESIINVIPHYSMLATDILHMILR